MKPIKITAYLTQALAGNPPMLDSLLMYQVCRNNNLPFIDRKSKIIYDELPKLPLKEFEIEGKKLYACSDPICSDSEATDVEYFTYRISPKAYDLIIPEKLKNLLIASGCYKMIRKPIRTEKIKNIVWFAVGNIEEVRKLLNQIYSLGGYKKMGYGRTSRFEVEEIKEDISLSCENILMKTIPCEKEPTFEGCRISYGAFRAPYWHPVNYTRIIEPC